MTFYLRPTSYDHRQQQNSCGNSKGDSNSNGSNHCRQSDGIIVNNQQHGVQVIIIASLERTLLLMFRVCLAGEYSPAMCIWIVVLRARPGSTPQLAEQVVIANWRSDASRRPRSTPQPLVCLVCIWPGRTPQPLCSQFLLRVRPGNTPQPLSK